MMRLKIQSAESEATRVLEVPDGDFEWTLGRSPTCTVVLEGTGISRRHARISRSGTGDILLEDTDSTAGTTLNGRPLSAATAFRQHDTAGIGPWVLQLEVEQEVRPEACRPLSDSDFIEEFKNASVLYTPDVMSLTRRIHESVLEKMNLSESALQEIGGPELREKMERCLDLTLKEFRHEIPGRIPMPLFRARGYSNTSFTFPRTVLKSFRVEVQETSGGAWRTVYETDSNHQRLVRGAIDRDVVAVRLMPLSTWGSERLNNTYDSAVAHIFAFDLA